MASKTTARCFAAKSAAPKTKKKYIYIYNESKRKKRASGLTKNPSDGRKKKKNDNSFL